MIFDLRPSQLEESAQICPEALEPRQTDVKATGKATGKATRSVGYTDFTPERSP